MKTVDDAVKALAEGRADLKVVDLSEPRQVRDLVGGIPRVKTGTTTCALKVKDGVVLAADKRASAGAYVASRRAEKLHEITRNIWMTIAGGVADAQSLIDIMRAECKLYELRRKKEIPVKAAARHLANILYNNKTAPYEVGLLLGGFSEQEGPVIYDIGSYGSLLDEDYASVGSGSSHAIGVLETNWKEGLSAEQGKQLAITAIKSAIVRDIFTGNGVDVVVITKTGSQFDHVSIQ